jgi:hypothetical protein
MVHAVSHLRLFHVTRQIAYNRHPALIVGAEVEVGKETNPFFGFYEQARTYPVSLPTGTESYGAVHLLKEVQAGRLRYDNLPTVAVDVARHYLMLTRELIMEEVRREVAPLAPSRQRCLYAGADLDLARHWKDRLGGEGRILEIAVTGCIVEADPNLLLGDSEPLSVTYCRARRYWQGEKGDAAEAEVLVSGWIKVVAEHS